MSKNKQSMHHHFVEDPEVILSSRQDLSKMFSHSDEDDQACGKHGAKDMENAARGRNQKSSRRDSHCHDDTSDEDHAAANVLIATKKKGNDRSELADNVDYSTNHSSDKDDEAMPSPELKRQRRLEANRRSAALSRLKRKELIENLEQAVSDLSNRNEKLSAEVQSLRAELSNVRRESASMNSSADVANHVASAISSAAINQPQVATAVHQNPSTQFPIALTSQLPGLANILQSLAQQQNVTSRNIPTASPFAQSPMLFPGVAPPQYPNSASGTVPMVYNQFSGGVPATQQAMSQFPQESPKPAASVASHNKDQSSFQQVSQSQQASQSNNSLNSKLVNLLAHAQQQQQQQQQAKSSNNNAIGGDRSPVDISQLIVAALGLKGHSPPNAKGDNNGNSNTDSG